MSDPIGRPVATTLGSLLEAIRSNEFPCPWHECNRILEAESVSRNWFDYDTGTELEFRGTCGRGPNEEGGYHYCPVEYAGPCWDMLAGRVVERRALRKLLDGQEVAP